MGNAIEWFDMQFAPRQQHNSLNFALLHYLKQVRDSSVQALIITFLVDDYD